MKMNRELKLVLLTLLFMVSYCAADTFIMYKNTRFVTGQVTADSSAPAEVIPVTSTTTRRAVSYCNDGVNKVYYGSSTAVVSTTGHVLPAGVCVSFEVNPLTAST